MSSDEKKSDDYVYHSMAQVIEDLFPSFPEHSKLNAGCSWDGDDSPFSREAALLSQRSRVVARPAASPLLGR
jgi:hypothetical protein